MQRQIIVAQRGQLHLFPPSRPSWTVLERSLGLPLQLWISIQTNSAENFLSSPVFREATILDPPKSFSWNYTGRIKKKKTEPSRFEFKSENLKKTLYEDLHTASSVRLTASCWSYRAARNTFCFKYTCSFKCLGGFVTIKKEMTRCEQSGHQTRGPKHTKTSQLGKRPNQGCHICYGKIYWRNL